MMRTEIWKDIDGYGGKYQVSNLGNVRSMWRNNQYQKNIGQPTLLKPSQHKQGYLYVYLSDNDVKKKHYVHRLVAQAFIPNPDNLPQVNHKSEVKTENFVENLEWCDGKYNSNYGTRVERWKPQVVKPIIQTTLDGKFVRKFESAEAAERECGYDAAYLNLVCHGKRPQAYGYKFHFAQQGHVSPEEVLKQLDALFDNDISDKDIEDGNY